jgi:hypothetical protein
MEGVRELQTQADQVLTILRFMERLEAQAIVQDAIAEDRSYRRRSAAARTQRQYCPGRNGPN